MAEKIAVRTQLELDAALASPKSLDIRIEPVSGTSTPIFMIDATTRTRRIEVMPRVRVRRVRVCDNAKLELVVHAQASLDSFHVYGEAAARLRSVAECIPEVTVQENACLEASLDGTRMVLSHKSQSAIAYVELAHGAYLSIPDGLDPKGLTVLCADKTASACPKLAESILRPVDVDPNDDTGFYVLLGGVHAEHTLIRYGTQVGAFEYVDHLRDDLNVSRRLEVSFPFTRECRRFGEAERYARLNGALARFQPALPHRQPRYTACTSW